jgi:hypothetical protein
MELFDELRPAHVAPRPIDPPGIGRPSLRPLDDPRGNARSDQQARRLLIGGIQKIAAALAVALGHVALHVATLVPCVVPAKSMKGA